MNRQRIPVWQGHRSYTLSHVAGVASWTLSATKGMFIILDNKSLLYADSTIFYKKNIAGVIYVSTKDVRYKEYKKTSCMYRRFQVKLILLCFYVNCKLDSLLNSKRLKICESSSLMYLINILLLIIYLCTGYSCRKPAL